MFDGNVVLSWHHLAFICVYIYCSSHLFWLCVCVCAMNWMKIEFWSFLSMKMGYDEYEFGVLVKLLMMNMVLMKGYIHAQCHFKNNKIVWARTINWWARIEILSKMYTHISHTQRKIWFPNHNWNTRLYKRNIVNIYR